MKRRINISDKQRFFEKRVNEKKKHKNNLSFIDYSDDAQKCAHKYHNLVQKQNNYYKKGPFVKNVHNSAERKPKRIFYVVVVVVVVD